MNAVEPDGRAFETVWDVVSLVMGVSSFVENVKSGNVGGAILDGVGIVVDAAAIAMPLVPGGAGAGIKAARAVDKAVDTLDKAISAGKAVGKYSDVPNPKNIKEGGNFTRSQKKNILEQNKKHSGG